MPHNLKLTPFANYCDEPGLKLIANWRNQTRISLRSIKQTYPELQTFWYKAVIENKSVRYFYIHDEHNGITGYCGLDKISNTNKTAEISLLINPSLHKKGYGSLVVEKLLKYGFTELKLNCIFAEVYTTTKNWDFWQKCGFRPEGMLRQRKFWNGSFYHSVIGSVLKEDWEK